MSELLIKPFSVAVSGHMQTHTYFAASRGKAMAAAWRDLRIAEDITFKDALRRISVKRCAAPERFGDEISVGGDRAFFVGNHGSHIRFVRPDSETILISHPHDVEWRPTRPHDTGDAK